MPPFPLSGCVSDTMQDVDGLYAWIDTIPLSRPKKNIARDFADGVLMSEVVSHFLPKFVDLHNYPSASSVASRKVNWETLNRRVFLKMGMRVSDETILQLVDAKSGIVEQVLIEVQSKIEQLLQNGNYQHQGGYLRSKSQHQCRTDGSRSGSQGQGQGHRQGQGQPLTSSSLNRAFTVSARGKRSRASAHNIVNKKSALLMSPDGPDGSLSPNPNPRFRAVSVPKKNHQHQGINSPNFKQGYVAAPHLNGINNGKYPIPPATIPSEIDPTLQKQLQQQQQYSLDASAAAAVWQHQQNDPNQKFPAPWDTVEGFLRTKSRSRQQQQQQLQLNSNSPQTATAPLPVPVPVAPVPVRYSNNDFGSMSSRQSVKSSLSDRFDEAPNQIIYRGHKMVPLQFLDEKEREMKNLETINRRLTLKIFRLETLVNIKDQRVEDLTHQLQSYRALYDAVSDKKGLPAVYKKQAAIDAEINSKTINPLPSDVVTSLPADSAQHAS